MLVGLCATALVGCALGLLVPIDSASPPGRAVQVLDVVRLLSTAVMVIVLVLGPGLLWRARGSTRRLELGFVPLLGLGLLVLTGGLAWVLAGAVSPRIVSAVVLVPILAMILAAVARTDPRDLFTLEERSVLVIFICVLGIAAARALWSLGPVGELLGGSIYRTLEVGDRPDSRISYGVVQLIAHGGRPYGAAASAYFAPYNFSARGPLAGMASAPPVLLAGGVPPTGTEAHPWLPFDPQGFMAYRLAMMSFAGTALLSLWTLARRLAGSRSAWFAVALAATTPFVVHEVWFTWPKLLAASFVLLAAASLIDRRPLISGLLIGVGYLVHPLVLLSLPALVLLALWPLTGARLRRPQLRAGLYLLGGVAIWLVSWRVANGSHYDQSDFLHYVTQAGRGKVFADDLLRSLGGHPGPVTLGQWIADRAVAIANTLVPLRLFLFSSHDPSINVVAPCYPLCAGRSPGVVHFFFQYWNTLPFGIGIAFFPLLLVSLWRATRRWPWAIFTAIIVPFGTFAVYWGDASTGLLREGLHVWMLTLLAGVAIEQGARGFPWLRSSSTRALLSLRVVEVLLVAVAPTIATTHQFLDHRFAVTDSLALLTMTGVCGTIAVVVWRETDPFRARTHLFSAGPDRSAPAGRSAPRD